MKNVSLTLFGDSLVLADFDNMPRQSITFQLKHWGFSFDRNTSQYIYNGSEVQQIAAKVSEYFLSKGIDIVLSNELQEKLLDQTAEAEALLALREKARRYKQGAIEQVEFDNFSKFLNEKINRKLKTHQEKAAYHHYLLGNSADFSVPGSGKTTTLLSVYEKARIDKRANKLFVVGPLSCFEAWKSEFYETLGRQPEYIELSGLSKENRHQHYYDYYGNIELYLVSFQTFSNDCKEIADFFSSRLIRAFFVVDEAHYLKQVDGKWASAVLGASKYAVCRHLLTGTPCPRQYRDLFNIFDLLWGKDRIINKRDKTQIDIAEKNGCFSTARTILSKEASPFFYRVRKKDLGLTEPHYHDPIVIDMNPIERQIYNCIKERILLDSRFNNNRSIETILSLKRAKITRLREVISHPKLLTTALESSNDGLCSLDVTDDINSLITNYERLESPAKLTALLDLVNELVFNNNKVLIWTNFIGTIMAIHAKLSSGGHRSECIYGAIPSYEQEDPNIKTRARIIKEFLEVDSGIDVLIANPAACAESVSLHKTCHHAIYYDLSYNCAQFLQSLDRIHRVGGSENTISNYYFLQYADTIDQDIHNNLIQKRDKMFALIEEDADIYNIDYISLVEEDEICAAYDRLVYDSID